MVIEVIDAPALARIAGGYVFSEITWGKKERLRPECCSVILFNMFQSIVYIFPEGYFELDSFDLWCVYM